MAHSRCAVPSALAALAVALATSALRADGPDQTIEAIWRLQLVEFTYNSRDVYYSCGALREKIVAILAAVGAHPHMAIDLRCAGGRLANHAHARVFLAVPAEATPENVRAATTFDTREALIARLRKLNLPTPNDIERFPAHWQSVSLSHLHSLHLDASDCDLLLAIRRDVLPKLPVRVASEKLLCAFGAASRIPPHLNVVALMRAPKPPPEDAIPSGTAGGSSP